MSEFSIFDNKEMKPLIQLDGVTKNFAKNVVLSNVDFKLRAGEIHALCGENGAGKSTCLGLLYGLHQPTKGNVYVDGELQNIETPSHAQALGISCVFQELSLAGALSVAENIFAGRVPSQYGLVNWQELHQRAEALLDDFGLNIDVSMPVDNLPISSRQIVEIAKSLSLNSRILLLDEPTSALAPDEVDALFEVLRKLTRKGIGIVYVSHHMSEIFRISDRVTVLRDGRQISTLPVSETSQERVISEMIGGAQLKDIKHFSNTKGKVVLAVNKLSQPKEFKNITFTIKAGEIVGMAGLMGARRSEIVRSIIGLTQAATGSIELNGNLVKFKSLRHAMRHGIGFVPEERKTEGLFLEQSLSNNLISASLQEHATLGMIHQASIKDASKAAIKAFSVKSNGIEENVGALSGGNQQKIILSRELNENPKILLVGQPTRGVDIGAIEFIHQRLIDMRDKGAAILLVSVELDEVLSLSDRILVMFDGNIVGERINKDVTDRELGLLMACLLYTSPSPRDRG